MRLLLRDKHVHIGDLHRHMKSRRGILNYYSSQLRYRWVWDLMQRDRTFRAMYDIIAEERETFLEQFCDSKDKHRSLSRTVLKVRHIPKLTKYAWYILLDLFH